MDIVTPQFLPDPDLEGEAMEGLQEELAESAVFEDRFDFDPTRFDVETSSAQQSLANVRRSEHTDTPVVAGVDQAFTDDAAVSAVVCLQNGTVIERVTGRAPTELPYIPGLLSFREGPAIIDALEALETEPDLLILDGSGRIHYREAGIATHVGVLFDVPAIGVAKNLLCGSPVQSLEGPLPEGTRIAIESNERVSCEDGTTIGYSFQSRQYPTPETRHVNPLYVSPGHRVGPETAVDLVETLCAGYKLPEPTRLADADAGNQTR